MTELSCDQFSLDDLRRHHSIFEFVNGQLAPIVPGGSGIMTFDGFDGVGKSTLANLLGERVGVPVIGLDDFIEKGREAFLDAVKRETLDTAITDAIAHRGRVIVEGCLVDAALETVGKTSGFRFYVMRTTRMSSAPEAEWAQERDILFGEKSTAELIADEEELAQQGARLPKRFGGGGSGTLSNFRRELILYHRNRRPHENANVVIKIVHWN